MSVRYRLKRNSGPVHEPIPAHPDALYRPQNRPTPTNVRSIGSGAIAPRAMTNNAVVAAPLVASGSDFSPWWIIGPLLAAIALGALAYGIKKKHDSRKHTEEENLEEDDTTRILRVDNVPLRSMKPDTIPEEQTRMMSIPSTAEGNSTSNTNPFLSNEQFEKSELPVHGLPLTNDSSSTLSSSHPDIIPSLSHQIIPGNATRMTKPNSDASKQSDEKNTSETVHNTLTTNPLLVSPSENIRSVLNYKTEPNYSGNLLPTPTTSSTSSTVSSREKYGPSNEFKKAPLGENLTNVSHADHTEPLKAGLSNEEFNKINDRNALNKPGDDDINQLNSPEQHGIGKSPLISDIPIGSRRRGKEKPQNRTNQIEKKKSSSNPNLRKQNSSKENISSKKSKNPSLASDTNKDTHQSTSTLHSKRDPLSEPNETISSTSVTSTEPTKETNLAISRPNYSDEKSNKNIVEPSDQYSMLNKTDLGQLGSRHIQSFPEEVDSIPSDNRLQSHIDPSHRQKLNTSNDDKFTNHGKTLPPMPNVPQCKTNTSSGDDDYDEIYPIPTDNSPIQRTTSKPPKTLKPNSNLNINASIYRKNRTLLMHRPLTKRFHLKHKIFHSNKNDNQ